MIGQVYQAESEEKTEKVEKISETRLQRLCEDQTILIQSSATPWTPIETSYKTPRQWSPRFMQSPSKSHAGQPVLKCPVECRHKSTCHSYANPSSGVKRKGGEIGRGGSQGGHGNTIPRQYYIYSLYFHFHSHPDSIGFHVSKPPSSNQVYCLQGGKAAV